MLSYTYTECNMIMFQFLFCCSCLYLCDAINLKYLVGCSKIKRKIKCRMERYQIERTPTRLKTSLIQTPVLVGFIISMTDKLFLLLYPIIFLEFSNTWSNVFILPCCLIICYLKAPTIIIIIILLFSSTSTAIASASSTHSSMQQGVFHLCEQENCVCVWNKPSQWKCRSRLFQ